MRRRLQGSIPQLSNLFRLFAFFLASSQEYPNLPNTELKRRARRSHGKRKEGFYNWGKVLFSIGKEKKVAQTVEFEEQKYFCEEGELFLRYNWEKGRSSNIIGFARDNKGEVYPIHSRIGKRKFRSAKFQRCEQTEIYPAATYTETRKQLVLDIQTDCSARESSEI